MPGGEDTRDAVERATEIVATLRLDRPGMQRHPHAERVSGPPIRREDRPLGGEGGVQRGGGGGEDGIEGVAHGLEDHAAVPRIYGTRRGVTIPCQSRRPVQ